MKTEQQPSASIVNIHHKSDVKDDLSRVDIIMPLVFPEQSFRACLDNILGMTQQTDFNVVVIVDGASVDDQGGNLDPIVTKKNITLISNSERLGHTSAINRGIALHPERDVVVINAPVEVNGLWLDRLRECAGSQADVATVSPFSNDGSLCGYPDIGNNDALPDNLTPESLDRLFATVNARQYQQVPMANPSCVYIRRHCLDLVGFLDAIRFRDACDAIEDFSLRASDHGFRNLLCGDVFVAAKPLTEASYQERNNGSGRDSVLGRVHPGLEEIRQDYCRQDPARPLRRRIDVIRLMQSDRPKLLFIDRGVDGESSRQVRKIAELVNNEFEVLIARSADRSAVAVEWFGRSNGYLVHFPMPGGYQNLLSFARDVGVARIHYHRVDQLPSILWKLPADLAVAYDFTAHDYYSICPQRTMIGIGGHYCGEEGVAQCIKCLKANPAPWGLDINSWRSMFGRFLTRAERIIAPSEDACTRINRYFPDANIVYLPHPEEVVMSEPRRLQGPLSELKVVVMLADDDFDQSHLIEQIFADVSTRELPLVFCLFGAVPQVVEDYRDIAYSVDVLRKDAPISTLIERERADVIFFPRVFPEVFCDLLGDAMQTGLPIVAPRLGALPERLAGYHSKILSDWQNSPGQWNDLLTGLLARSGDDFGDPLRVVT